MPTEVILPRVDMDMTEGRISRWYVGEGASVAKGQPIFEIETTGAYDRFGPLRWGAGETPEVDVSRPTAYRRLAFTRYGGRTLAQLFYMIWFPERPQSGPVDPLSGTLDGIVFRVTLDATGRPLVYDSIHLCGCYHMFFPTSRVKPIPPPDPEVEWAFVPRTRPEVVPLRLRQEDRARCRSRLSHRTYQECRAKHELVADIFCADIIPKIHDQRSHESVGGRCRFPGQGVYVREQSIA